MKKIFNFFIEIERPFKRVIQVFFDILFIFLSVYLALLLRLGQQFDLSFFTNTFPILIITLPVTLIVFTKLGHYRAILRYISAKAMNVTIIGVLISALTIYISSVILSINIPKSLPIIYFGVLLFFIGGTRLFYREIYNFLNHKKRIATILFGVEDTTRQLIKSLNVDLNYKPVCLIETNIKLIGTVIDGLEVYSSKEIKKIINKFNAKLILISTSEKSNKIKNELFKYLTTESIEIKIIPKFKDLFNQNLSIRSFKNISYEQLMNRTKTKSISNLMTKNIFNKKILVTGAGGSIGFELCKQILYQKPKYIILFDISEYGIYSINQELNSINHNKIKIIPIIGSVTDEQKLKLVFENFSIDTIYHAAAYKHVPLLELNIVEAIKNNVFGTNILAQFAVKFKVKNFILISTDKAVRPTNFMGASKRFAELICQGLAKTTKNPNFSIVRFGNVIGSSGSVIPLFSKQIESGGPITLTHPEINRYFMTVEEAAELVIQASSIGKSGDVFVLDMGKPIKIIDIAKTLIRLYGYEPFINKNSKRKDNSIEIKFTKLRFGEKLYEELLINNNPKKTIHKKIFKANEFHLDFKKLNLILKKLSLACENHDINSIQDLLKSSPIEFNQKDKNNDLIFNSKIN
ncbi:polysaccharide biosynthesis protein [Alphaproteobacteria bacterium]|nr:polysaccharide biosynthesis protein [Alphaproteobacteria bacterium]